VRCKTCAYPDTKPDLHFQDGECSACRSYKSRPEIDWESRKEELVKLLDRHDGKCIIPSSGGKDSTYQVVKLKEMGADPIIVTATTCHLTPIGRRNIDNLAKQAITIESAPDPVVRAKLNRYGLEMVGDISWPEHAGIFSMPFRMAVEYNYPLIFYGENPQNQYGGPVGSDEAKQMTRRWTQEYGGFLGLRPSDFVGMNGISSKHMEEYELPKTMKDVEAHFLGQYIPWDSHDNALVAAYHGMEQKLPAICNWWDFENLDNAQTGIHDHMMYLKYGFGRMTSQISVDIRSGRISREEALKIIEAREHVFPEVYAGVSNDEILDRIDMDMPRLQKIMDQFTNKALFRRVVDDASAPMRKFY